MTATILPFPNKRAKIEAIMQLEGQALTDAINQHNAEIDAKVKGRRPLKQVVRELVEAYDDYTDDLIAQGAGHADWTRVANALSELAADHGIECD